MMRLTDATLRQAPPGVSRPDYDRRATRVGVVHFGPGAFHRAHQAWYFDRMLAQQPDLAICAVSLRTRDLREALAPQDGLYTLAEKEAEPALRVIGSIREVLVAADDPEAVFSRLDEARFVTATVTEKGYCLNTDGGLDLTHPEIVQDLANPESPQTLIGWLAEALGRRHAAGRLPFTTISCDNLSDNGAKLGRGVGQFVAARGRADLARWIAEKAAFPCSMVDSITPATDDALRAQVAEALGLVDAWPVQRERFVQWVVEDRLGAEAALFAGAGVTLTEDVGAFERAKLRLLNGAHSTLAYVGLGLGYDTVSQAMADPTLAAFVERMMRLDVAPTLEARDLDVSSYISQILARFRNPAIVHRLSQIAWDGSQKLRFRLLETIADAAAAGRPLDRLAVGVAAWMRFIAREASAGNRIVDPLSASLTEVGRQAVGVEDDVRRFLAVGGVFPAELAANPRFQASLTAAYLALHGQSAQALRI